MKIEKTVKKETNSKEEETNLCHLTKNRDGSEKPLEQASWCSLVPSDSKRSKRCKMGILWRFPPEYSETTLKKKSEAWK